MSKELATLAKKTSFLAGTRMIQFVVGLVRVKISALILGTTGIGIVDQLTFLSQKISRFTLLGISEALVKQIAENKDKEDVETIINSALKSYCSLMVGLVIVSLTGLTIFSEYLSKYVFGSSDYIMFFFVGLLTLPILVFQTIPFSILKAFKDIKYIARARIYTVILNLIIGIPLIVIFKLNGAVIFIPISYCIEVSANFFFARKIYFKKYNITLTSIYKAETKKSFINELFLFSSYGLTVGVLLIISEFVCRAIVVNKLGVGSIGLYSPVILFASIFVGFILPALSTYLYPIFCEVKTDEEVVHILNEALRLCSFLLIPFLFVSIPYREFFISLVYSDEFLSSEKYLPFHFIGIVFYIWFYVLSQYLTPRGKIKIQGIFRTFYFATDVVVTYIFVKKFGLYGWMLKHIISPMLFFFVYGIYSFITINFRIKKSTIFLMVYLITGSLSIYYLEKYFEIPFYITPFIVIALIGFAINFLTSQEKEFSINKLKKILT